MKSCHSNTVRNGSEPRFGLHPENRLVTRKAAWAVHWIEFRSITGTRDPGSPPNFSESALIIPKSAVATPSCIVEDPNVESAMQLSRTGYYSDFVVYPAIILVLATTELRPPESVGQLEWLITCFVGITGGTLAEYLIHRFVFHRLPIVARMHDAHHSRPSALISAPI
jgi:hypothetical protein